MQAINLLKPKLSDGERIEALCRAGAIPEYFSGIPARLAELSSIQAQAQAQAQDPTPAPASADGMGETLFLAGGTDLYVQRGEQIPEMPLALLN